MSDPLAGVDYSQYPSWQRITAPTGAVYYVVPGTGYVYDPFLSAQKGRPVLWTNPQPALDEKAKVEDERQRQIKQQEKASSPEGQIVPVAGTVVGTVGGAYVVNKGVQMARGGGEVAAPQVNTTPPPSTTGQAFSQGATGSAPQAQLPAGSSPGAPSTPRVVGVQRVDANGNAIMQDGSTVNGNTVTFRDGTVVENGKVTSEGSSGLDSGQAIAAAAFLLQSYVAYKTLNDPNASTADKTAAVGGATAAGATLYATTGGAGSATASSVGSILGPIVGVYQGYKTAEYVADAPAGSKRNQMTTAGGAASGAAIGSYFGPWGTVIGGVVGAAAGLTLSLTGSSKDQYQMIRDKGREYLIEKGIIGQDYQGTLADGTKFDFGKDGKGLKKLDYDDPLTSEIISYADSIAAGEGFNGRSKDAMVELYTNAALSNANGNIDIAKANIRHFMQQRQFTPEAVEKELDRQEKAGLISSEERQIWADKVRASVGGVTPSPMAPPAAAPPGTQPPAAPAPGAPKVQQYAPGSSRAAYVQAASGQGGPLPGASVPYQPMPMGSPITQAPIQSAPMPMNQPQPGTPIMQAPVQSGPMTMAPQGGTPIVQAAQQQPAQPAPVTIVLQQPARSSTRSPGYSLDGRRLSPQEMGKRLAKRMDRR